MENYTCNKCDVDYATKAGLKYHACSASNSNELLCEDCNGEGVIFQDDGSDSTGTLIDCYICGGSGHT